MAWAIDECVLKDCPLVKKGIDILFQPEDLIRIKALLRKYPDKEWLMYLYGDITVNGVMISGMTIPKQEVSGGSVDNIEAPLPGCIGTIHSHNSMGAFHSGTDQTYIENNHKVCITVNNKLEFSSTVDVLSECKRPMRVKAEVFQVEPLVDLVNFLKDADENIKERSITTLYQGYQSSPYYQSREWDPKKGEWVDKKEIKENASVKRDAETTIERTAEDCAGYWG